MPLIAAIQNWIQNAMNGARLQPIVCGLLGVLIATVGVLGIYRYPIHFDEMAHFGNLHAVSIGKSPHTDFWCIYPSPAYAVYATLYGMPIECLGFARD